MARRLAPLFGTLLSLTMFSGCLILDLVDLFVPDGTAQSDPYSRFRGRPERFWDEVKEVVAKHWTLKEIDEDSLHLATEWDVMLGAFYQTGFRRRALVWVIDTAGGPYVEIRVERDKNMNIKDPLTEALAEWEHDGRDGLQELRLINELDARLREYGPSERAAKEGDKPYLAPVESDKRDPEDRLWKGMDR